MQRCVAAEMDRILPRSLAGGRWRFRRRAFCAAAVAAVSGRGQQPLHDAALLPHSVRGILSNYSDHYRPEWFVRPRGNASGSPSISMPYGVRGAVRDHCNGLVLHERENFDAEQSLWVLNPATRRLAVLPPPPREGPDWPRTTAAGAYLAFDPSVSLQYDVFLVPEVPGGRRDGDELAAAAATAGRRLEDDDDALDGWAEWPPAVHRMQVYSSRSGAWEERAFVREQGNGPVGTVAEARSDSVEPVYLGPLRRYAVCWRGALYVHCRGAYVMRLSLLEDKYQTIKTPINIEESKQMHTNHYLGRSVKGVYYVVLKYHELRVWRLDESSGQMEWVLEHHKDLEALDHRMKILDQQRETLWYDNEELIKQPWAMLYHIIDSDKNDLEVQEASEWNSDDDDILEITKQNLERDTRGEFEFLGFHPYKEVMFLSKRLFNVVTYHLGSSKAHYLGNAYPYDYEGGPWATFEESFIYTPCLVDSLPKDELSIFEPMDKVETSTGPSI